MVPRERGKSGSVLDPRHKPPPNYFSRGVQTKILMLVFLFMTVLVLMSEARKPENWRWMWQLDRAAQGTGAPARAVGNSDQDPRSGTSGETLDTHVPLSPMDPDAEQLQIGGGESSASFEQSIVSVPVTGTGGVVAELDGWNHVARRLSKEQRQLLQEGMWSWRHQRPLSDTQQTAWNHLLQRLSEQWTDYVAWAEASLSSDGTSWTAAQHEEGRAAIEALRVLWSSQHDALAALATGEPLTPGQAEALRGLQDLFDRRAWAQVEDNAGFGSAETEAWYRCWEQLQRMTPRQQAEAEGPLNFVQLFSQPDELRGRLIRINGTARWGYPVTSNNPRYGIEHYYVMGLLPNDGSSSPIVVYSLELPAGFPDLYSSDTRGKGKLLDEDIEVTGYYFKRWLHRSEAGMNLSPLILGRITKWQPSANHDRRDARGRMTPRALLSAIAATALLAVGFAVWVHRSSHWSSLDVVPGLHAPATLPSFGTDEVRGSVHETLREFADQNQSGAGGTTDD